MAAAWEERFGKLDRAAEALEKIVAIDSRNYGAYRELARLYQQAGKYEALVETYRNHIAATTDVATRVELYVAMGQIYEAQPQEVDRAIEAYTDVLGIDPDEQRALDALGRLYEQISEWDRAIDVMTQLVTLTDDLAQAGRPVLADGPHPVRPARRRRRCRGQPAPRRSRSIRPRARRWRLLVKQYSDRGDWLKAAQMMVRAESYTPVAIDKVRLLFEAANIYHDQLRQDDQAKQLLRRGDRARPRARRGGPAARRAVLRRPAVGRAVAGDRHAVPQGRPAPRRPAPSSTSSTTAPRRRADELGDYQKALGYYKAAYDIDSTYLPTLVGRADLLFKMQDWDAAGKIYQTILVQHRDGQDEATSSASTTGSAWFARPSASARRRSTCSRRRSRSIRPTARPSTR